MIPYLLFLLLVTSSIEGTSDSNNITNCNEFQANFDIKSVIGSWYVVAIIPGKLFPEQQVACYKVEFSETDGAGLRWLVNRTLGSHKHANLTQNIQGTIIRQRCFSEHPFDVWAKSIDGVNGCFQQVLSLDTDMSDIHKAVAPEAVMQLHLLENNDSNPFLIQILYGKMVSGVIYRKQQGVTQDQLKPSFELLTKLRGPQRLPRICDSYIRDLVILND